MKPEEFEEWIKRNPGEAARLISKAFKPRELLTVGNRSYRDAYKYPESRFDLGDLCADGHNCPPPDMLQPHVDPLKLLTDKYMIPPSQMVFGSGGLYYRKSDWGQIAGGLTDATTVTQATINALLNGGKIFIKRGIYNVTNLYTKSGIELCGEGYSTVLQLPLATDTPVIRTTGIVENITISNLRINANSVGGNGHHGILLDSVTGTILIKNLWVHNAKYAGIIFNSCSAKIIAEKCYLYNNRDGIEASDCNDVTFIGLRAFDNIGAIGRYAIGAERCIYVTIIGCIASGQITGNGIDIDASGVSPCKNVVISGCQSYNNNGWGIKVDNIAGGAPISADMQTIIIGCLSYDNDEFGICVDGGRHTIISGCNIYRNGWHGICLTTNSLALISGCHVFNQAATYSGIVLEDTYGVSGHIKIIGNKVFDDQGIATQKYGIINNSNGSALEASDNEFFGHVTSAINDTTGTLILKRNTGFVTENSGTAIIAAAATSIVVPHGCSYTPSALDVSIVLTNLPTNDIGDVYVDTFGAVNFTIHCRNVPGAATAIFNWRVIRTP